VFKKEEKNSREVRGGEELSTGLAQDVLTLAEVPLHFIHEERKIKPTKKFDSYFSRTF
jgi:hypothetical protein